MLRQFLLILTTIIIAFVILFVSITQTAQIKYSFTSTPERTQERLLRENVTVDFYFPHPGRILPDHPLWSVKALRDQLWLMVTPKAERRAELNLLFANKRIISSRILFGEGKNDLAMTVLVKSSRYLDLALIEEEKARANNVNTEYVLSSIHLASVKHLAVLKEIMEVAPADVKPEIAKVEEVVSRINRESESFMTQEGITLKVK